MPSALNRFLGTSNIDPQSLKDLLLRPPYREIRHTLSGPRPLRMSRVTKEQQHKLNTDYPLRVHSRALCRVGPEFEEPFDHQA
ncbi:hypothetical protein HAX54_030106 [Datura stramonium]|uniref:Uncharacterized protein n=1 Tax=Datura stramonium TaxID=4076 RepID=A0ABS8V7H5_DATST|nr:hypothetical protein [Datura stramonium]